MLFASSLTTFERMNLAFRLFCSVVERHVYIILAGNVLEKIHRAVLC